RPRAVTLDKYDTGTISVDSVNSPQTVTGNGVNWSNTLLGSVIRVSGNAQPPTGFYGSNPAVFERNLRVFVSSNNYTVDDAIPQSFTNAAYQISDPIDIEDGAMLEGFFRCCEKHCALQRNMKDKKDYIQAYELALIRAKEADARNFSQRVAGTGGPY